MGSLREELDKPYQSYMRLKQESYEYVYKKCTAHMKTVANMVTSDDRRYCFFAIDEFVFGRGYPRIDHEECAKFIIEKLSKEDIHAKFVKPNILAISWMRETKKSNPTSTNYQSNRSALSSVAPN